MKNKCYNCYRNSIDEHGICTECGFNQKANREQHPMALPMGSILYGQYIVGKVLGQGGFGITYLAQDYQTKELVAIKEFFPDIMATRTNSITVTPFAGERGENFTFGRISFLDEAKTMADFNGNPNIVEVYSYFEENGTGYFVMEYVDGCSLQEYIKDQGGRLSWDETVKLMIPVLDALSTVHEKGIIHRDVTPDNIYITQNGVVKLLDFGAARYSLGNVSRSLDVVLKHGFAPKEQYKRHGRQGPYTDIYSVGATIYYALTGMRPDDSIERSDEDTMPMPSTLGARIARWQEKIILKAMAINPEDRYQSAAELAGALLSQSAPKVSGGRNYQKPQTQVRGKRPKWLIPGVAAAVALVLGVGIFAGSRLRGTEQLHVIAEPTIKTDAPIQETTTAEIIVSEPLQTYKLKSLEYDDKAVAAEMTLWGQAKYSRADVKTIRFQSTLEDAPLGAFDVSEAHNGTIWAWMDNYGNLTIAANGRIALPKNSDHLFERFRYLTMVDFNNCVDTSDVESMRCMFKGCTILTELDLSGFDSSNVTDMFAMFLDCTMLTSLDISGFDTSKVTNMFGMFNNCKKLAGLDLSGFDTSNVENMNGMFSSCEALNSLDLSGFDTSNVTDMEHMFYGCKKLTDLNLSGFDTSKVTNMASMFQRCNELNSLDLSGFNTSNVESMAWMFYDCSSMANLNLTGFEASKVNDMDFMFLGCTTLTEENLKCTDRKILNEFNN